MRQKAVQKKNATCLELTFYKGWQIKIRKQHTSRKASFFFPFSASLPKITCGREVYKCSEVAIYDKILKKNDHLTLMLSWKWVGSSLE